MAAKTVVSLSIRGINEIMKSPGVQADLMARAERIAAAAGDGFVASPGRPHPWVARAYVYTDTFEAKLAEATDRVLTRAVDAGR